MKQMDQKNRKCGFAMLETMVMIMVFMILAASLLATAAAYHKRAVKRAEQNEAYYAAVTAVKLMAGEIMDSNGTTAAGTALLGVGTDGMSEMQTAIEAKSQDDGTVREIPVMISSKRVMASNVLTYLTLQAKATAAGRTETVSVTLQERKGNSKVPDYPYGCGLMGELEMESGTELYLGPDSDLFLKGYIYSGSEPDLDGIRNVGGNLIVKNAPLNLIQVKIGGMIISDKDVSLEKCVVGNEDNTKRRGGIYTTGNLTLNNCDVYGDVYTNVFRATGTELIKGSLNYKGRSEKNYTVWDSEGKHAETQNDGYRRSGSIFASAGEKQILSELEDFVPKDEDVFVPQLDGISDVTVTNIRPGETVNIDIGDAVEPEDGKYPRWIVLMDGGTFNLTAGGEYCLYVYGNGTVNITGGDVTVYGGIQAQTVHISEGATLTIGHTQPKRKSLKTPSSAIGFGRWIPLDYDRETGA